MRRSLLRTILILFFFIGITMAMAAFFAWRVLYTPGGAEVAAQKAIEHFVDDAEISVASSSGNLREGVVFKDMEIELLRGGTSSVLKIQELTLKLEGFDLDSVSANVNNARLLLPQADPVVFFATIDHGKISIDGSTKTLSSRVIEENLPVDLGKDISFDIADIDLQVSGTRSLLKLDAKFNINAASYKEFKGSGSAVQITGDLEKRSGDWRPTGLVLIKGGEVSGKKTAVVVLEQGKIKFDKLWEEPELDIKGRSKVEKVKIDVTVKGSYKKPEIVLVSEPSFPQEKLALMLATNRSWSATEQAIKSGQVLSTDAAKEFLNYFFISGRENSFLKRMGIRDLDIQVEKGKRGISVTKDMNDNLSASYGVTQITNTEVQGGSKIEQRIGGEFKINENISAEFKKDLDFAPASGEPVQQPDDSIWLKYKKSF